MAVGVASFPCIRHLPSASLQIQRNHAVVRRALRSYIKPVSHRQALRCQSQQDPIVPQGPKRGSTPHSPVSPATGPDTPQNTESGFGNIERMIASNFNNVQPGLRGDWIEIEGNWVLRPLEGPTTSVVHFLGGAFVGAAPQLTYRLLLESLAARGIMVIATPFSTNFNHLRIADEIHYKWDRCIHNPVIAAEIRNLPVYGLGHSMGSLQHLLISARYASTSRAGNILMSFNNKPATDAIPFFSPFIAPGARALGPFLAQMTKNPFTSQLLNASELMRGLSPAMVRQVLPLLDQLTPIYTDLAQGRLEFTPEPDETKRLIRTFYGVPSNLLIQFVDDDIDQTPQLASTLNAASVTTSSIKGRSQVTVRMLPGDHVRPLRQAFGDLPPEIAQVANQAVTQGSYFLQGLSNMATQAGFAEARQPLDEFAKGLTGFGEVFGENPGADTELLVTEIVDWIDKGSQDLKALPGSSTVY
ncbi:hypothetical protein ABBQ32_001769 [Trebouxia sp. C0010 RCD-2024]